MPTINRIPDRYPDEEENKKNSKGFSPDARDKRYNSARWRRLRITVLKANPLCVECEAKGITNEARVVDHELAVRDGGEFWDIENLRGMCDKCHNSKSGRESHTRKFNYNK